MSKLGSKPSRFELLSLLSEACELEHALSCSYLYAAFSLKEGKSSDLEWDEQQDVSLWAAQLYFVASQEMLHLAQVWNLLTAVGGSPYYLHSPFPHQKGYYPIPVPLTLARFDVECLDRFLQWELPATINGSRDFTPISGTGPSRFDTVGDMYGRIAELVIAFEHDELFIGNPSAQVGADVVDFKEIVKVVDHESALQAIGVIRHQGEGSPEDRENCHFGVFHDIRTALKVRTDANPSFEPSYPVLTNPTRSDALAGQTHVPSEDVRDLMELFDDIYGLSIRMLAWAFGEIESNHPGVAPIARSAITAMPILLKPLGTTLASMPSGAGTTTAGAAFLLKRHVPFPTSQVLAERLIHELWSEVFERAGQLAERESLANVLHWLPRQVGIIVKMMGQNVLT